MKTFDIVNEEIGEGIPVEMEPYPHVVLGEGGHKRATWIPLGKRDAESIIIKTPIVEDVWDNETGRYYVKKNTGSSAHINDVSVIALKDPEGKPNGRFLIVAPRSGDSRVLILWRVSSGYRGSASISAGEGVTVVANDASWHSGRGNLGETAEMLAILKPGQQLHASRTGRRLQDTEAVLVWDGNTIDVTFGGTEMADAVSDDSVVEGDLL